MAGGRKQRDTKRAKRREAATVAVAEPQAVAPPEAPKVHAMGDGVEDLDEVQFAALMLREARDASRGATYDRSWQAVGALKRVEREAYAELRQARERAKAAQAGDPDDALTPEQFLSTVLLPTLGRLPRIDVEVVYGECERILGLRHDA